MQPRAERMRWRHTSGEAERGQARSPTKERPEQWQRRENFAASWHDSVFVQGLENFGASPAPYEGVICASGL